MIQPNPRRVSVFDVHTFEDGAKRKKGQKSRPKDANVEQLTPGGRDHMKVVWAITPVKQWELLTHYP